MHDAAWKVRLGPAWDVILKRSGLSPYQLAAVLTDAVELGGFRAPENPPTAVNPKGTATFWPAGVLTSAGLEAYYSGRGARYYLLRMPQLLRGMAGPLAPRLQEWLSVYEGQIAADRVSLLPEWADNRLFVGGEPRKPEHAEHAE